MTRTILSLAAAAAIGTAGLTAAPQKAEAMAWWVVPAIVGGVVVAGTVGAAAANANANAIYGYQQPYGYGPAPAGGAIYVRPTGGADCTIMRERMPNGQIRRVRVCE
jgi:hypothetical protein